VLAPSVLVVVALAYVALLFVIAWRGDRLAAAGRRPLSSPWIYALSLAVYCTAWTFYGSVGRAATDGYGFLPVYLGPTLGAALGWTVYRKIVRIAKSERIISIADFLASRYGKSSKLAALVAVVLVLGTVPYIALQLKAVATSFQVLWRAGTPVPISFPQLTLTCAGVLAVFAILFGTRSVDLTEQHNGLVLAIAFESLVKLVAFLAVGAWVVYGLFDGFGSVFAAAAADAELAKLLARTGASDGDWAWMTLVSLLAFWFLPRQFQVGVVENVDERHLRTASWLFPLYLLAINVFVLPIALAGRLLPATAGEPGDVFVLALPLAAGEAELAVLVFLGGLSAATGMVIVETLALSNMVANDLVLPLLIRSAGAVQSDLRGALLVTRRVAIVGLLLLGHVYAVYVAAGASLVSIGLVSFAAVAQLAPPLLVGLYWRGATRRGALTGLIAGFAVWGYTLPLPNLALSGLLPTQFVSAGPFGLAWLRPQALFGLDGMDPLSHSLVWSLLANGLGLVVVSTLGGATPIERRQAQRFVGTPSRRADPEQPGWSADTPVKAVRGLLARFLGDEPTDRALAAWAEARGVDLGKMAVADPELIAFAERLLAGTTGAATARVALASIAEEQAIEVDEVVHLLDETSRLLATSRELAEKSAALERASLDLQRANQRLRALDRLKDDYLSTMAHELRTPLTAIRAFAEILHDNPELEVGQRSEFLRIIARENERLTRLIHDLLELSTLEADAYRGRRESVALADVLATATRTLDHLASERRVRVTVEAGPGLPRLEGDPDRLTQVVVNLLSNAIKACPEQGGRVSLVVDPSDGCAGVPGPCLVLRVVDNGCGVPEAERELIFERFQRGSRRSGTEGTGLGLPISRRIVEQHGGKIWVEPSPDGGATFFVVLPLRRRPAATPTSEERP
jgi:Na+/proline symporter/nitrogen-specific signal transduction histidine kinase